MYMTIGNVGRIFFMTRIIYCINENSKRLTKLSLFFALIIHLTHNIPFWNEAVPGRHASSHSFGMKLCQKDMQALTLLE